jgi:hypothetical protein
MKTKRKTPDDVFTDEQLRIIETWERRFDEKNGVIGHGSQIIPHTIVIRTAKRLDPGEIAGWEWLLGHFVRINKSLRKSREPLVEFDMFPKTEGDVERIVAYRAAHPRSA